MSVVVGVRKQGKVAIASDTQTSQGSTLLPGEIKTSPHKIHKIGRAYLGIVGSTAHHRVVESLYREKPDRFDLTSSSTIFETFRSLQGILVDDYFLRDNEDDSYQEYDSNQMFGIIISAEGLFSFQSYREVTEFEFFWATGTGADFAIGSMESIYRTNKTAKSIAEEAVRVACRFDKNCGLPIKSHSMSLRA